MRTGGWGVVLAPLACTGSHGAPRRPAGEQHPDFIDGLRRLPQVADLGMASVALMAPDMGSQPPRYSALDRFGVIMSTDGRAGWTVNRPLILTGRQPDPGRPDELGLSESLARRWRVRPGDTVRLRALAPEQLVPPSQARC